MASPAADPDVPSTQQDRPEPAEPSHPEPACQEAQKWIEAVTGRSFGDRDFRSGLENGILLCELLSAIKPGVVKKINRLPTPIAGLDNLTVFLRGCEELGLKGSQLFDPGDLQDTSIRANLRDSDCNRKLKNVLNTVFWLGKAANGCASYSGPTLNLKEFEGLLAQMRMESEEGGEGAQKRGVRDSGYDCWDSERSESLSPPRHTRDNSLDSLDSFGSRSQHSPSPDVVNRVSDGRGSDSEADGPNRKPDVRRDDMLARRTASSESRTFVPFNQFLPNRANASSYIPAPRRKPRAEEGEQRRSMSMGDMLSEEEVGHIQPLSRSRFERMHEQYSNYEDEEDQWQDDLARWKNRRRSASQELIKKEEERKRMEKRLKEEGSDSNKRKSIKTYREIVEEKERREVDLCEAYRKAKTPEEAAMVLQRYALRFAISDATLDSLKLPRSTSSEFNLILQDQEQNPTDSITDSEASDAPHKPEQTDRVDPCPTHDDINTDAQEEPVALSPRPEAQNIPSASVTHSRQTPPQLQELRASQPHSTQSPTLYAQPGAQDAQPQAKQAPPAMAQGQPQPMQPLHTHSSPLAPPCRPVPLLSAKPYCQPRSTYSGQKSVKADGLVRVNGEVTEEVISATSPASSPLRPPLEDEDAPSEQPCGDQSTVEQRSPQREEKASTSSGSVISSLIGGRSRIVKTTIVTELTRVEPPTPDITSNGKVRDTFGLLENPAAEESETVSAVSPCSAQAYSPTVTEGLEESSVTIETPMLNLAKRVNHWVWDPNEERKRQERWQQEQERLLQAQYQREQEKLKEEWERAQREVEEEERKHNEEERRILEETAAPLQHSASSIQPASQTGAGPPPQIGHRTGGRAASTEHNGQRVLAGNEDQHASKLHFFQDSSCNSESSKKTEMWKTSSLDRNAQISQTNAVKRSGSHDNVIGTHQSPSSVPQPPSPSRCVSGKRLCSGCSQPLGKGAAMNIDTLGLFFHIQCFKCGVCDGQLGDTSTGTDVRIRNGLLSCHECYIASRGGGQPTTL
ncbi:LIM and calponin homology domains-containing protein 1a isoform X8 [Lampris incognitus]|uniref:LIM and calponin homology domains-containing protein 1a isoform X8 n=1 Tax=Lampris incognitus TaxID=2546036 RepID=UPI0024B4A060|nr:LIM and calponin homology domains-containing protein 1a isoform X8 [Lampris incognitus]